MKLLVLPRGRDIASKHHRLGNGDDMIRRAFVMMSCRMFLNCSRTRTRGTVKREEHSLCIRNYGGRRS